jgi:predicted ATPase
MEKSKISNQFVKEIKLKRDAVEHFNIYPFKLEAIKSLHSITLNPNVTFIVGENGSGKSTLLEATAVAYGFNAEGGSKNFNFSTEKTHSKLHKYITISRGVSYPKTGYFLRAESFYNVATEIDKLDKEPSLSVPIILSYGGVSLHKQSHGESFLSLMNKRFGKEGFYILDEPEAALSPQRQLNMLARIHELVKQNCQFVIATHSPILMSYPKATIYTITNGKFKKQKYKDTQHYQIYKYFLNNYKKMLGEILV